MTQQQPNQQQPQGAVDPFTAFGGQSGLQPASQQQQQQWGTN